MRQNAVKRIRHGEPGFGARVRQGKAIHGRARVIGWNKE
jgi:hypothetical protein